MKDNVYGGDIIKTDNGEKYLAIGSPEETELFMVRNVNDLLKCENNELNED